MERLNEILSTLATRIPEEFRPVKRYTGVLSIIAAIIVVVLLTLLNEGPEERKTAQGLMQVHVITVTPEKVTDIITGHGQISPRWQTTLSSEISGRVLSVSEKFLTGAKFNKGDILAVIDDTTAVAALKTVKARLSTAQRILKEEQQRSGIARDNWKSSGFKGRPSDLVLRKPQLSEAETAIESAKADIAKAEYDLAQTRITAPYDGVVIERTINPGDVLQKGSQTGRIYNRSLYDIPVPLSTAEIARLPRGAEQPGVMIRTTRTNKIWKGVISRIEQVIDSRNRWQNVVVSITETEGLLPGEFVSAAFTGRTYDHVLAIPENVPADNGEIWYVDDQDLLQRFTPDILYSNGGTLYVRPPPGKQGSMRLTVGRNTFLPDVRVEPVPEKTE